MSVSKVSEVSGNMILSEEVRLKILNKEAERIGNNRKNDGKY